MSCVWDFCICIYTCVLDNYDLWAILQKVSHRVIESNVCGLKHDSNQTYAYLTVNVFGDYLSD